MDPGYTYASGKKNNDSFAIVEDIVKEMLKV